MGSSNRRVALDGLSFAPALVWVLTVPLCPASVARILPNGAAAAFLGCLMLGCALYCLVAYLTGDRFRGIKRFIPASLPAALVLAYLLFSLSVPDGILWASVLGLLSGFGEASILLAWADVICARPLREVLSLSCAACAGAALVGIVLNAGTGHPTLLWDALIVCAVFAAVPVMAAPKPCDSPSHPTSRVGLFSQLWEPTLGLGLSFMSAVLPWGSLFGDSSASTPMYWAFAVGIALFSMVALFVARRFAGRVDVEVALHVAVPLLAAAVVGLRLLGDLDEIGAQLTVLKGVGSGAASAGFLVYAIVAMARVAKAHGAAVGIFSAGFGLACLIGFLTLPMHMLEQRFASLVAPFLSLIFLVAACCASIVHIRKHAAVHEPRMLSVEAAQAAVARQYGLSPRERQVLAQLMLGRSAESIGKVLGISANTVRSHVGNIHTKLGISSRDELADLVVEAMGGGGL